MRTLLAVSVLLALAACGEEETAQRPPPQEPTRQDVGYYCGMIVPDHPGPKAQIFIGGQEKPLWFTQVRDAIAFTLLPEETDDIRAFYVNDMAKAHDWDHPDAGAWIEAGDAYYVLGSARRGGMGALEAVPFGDRSAAETFAGQEGGTVVQLDAVPEDYVLGSDDSPAPGDAPPMHEHDSQGGDK